jgi:outer membrane biosynthesis protein TonB
MTSNIMRATLIASVVLHIGGVAPFFTSFSGGSSSKEKDLIYISSVRYESPKKEKVIVTSPRARLTKPKPVNPSSSPKEIKESVAKEKIASRNSADLANDPEKGKVFVGYFADVKERISTVVRRKYSDYNPGRGSVSLLFLLNASGSLEKVVVDERASTKNPFLRNFAKECIREAAPFGKFPKNLGSDRISFNVTVLFDES